MTRVGRAGIERTFQNIRLFRRMTVLENVLVANPKHTRQPFRSVLRSSRKADLAAALPFLELMGLTADADKLAGTLPYGDARRLEIARALATRPRLLLLDEPAAGMNEQETQRLAADIRAASRSVDAIMLVEHDMALIRALSSRLVALNAGRKICEGTPAEVLDHPEVKAAYLGAEDEP
jgi:branched-chain amino acid transport system ATP-binding protein